MHVCKPLGAQCLIKVALRKPYRHDGLFYPHVFYYKCTEPRTVSNLLSEPEIQLSAYELSYGARWLKRELLK